MSLCKITITIPPVPQEYSDNLTTLSIRQAICDREAALLIASTAPIIPNTLDLKEGSPDQPAILPPVQQPGQASQQQILERLSILRARKRQIFLDLASSN
jgi:hypothetical protein